jgi:hypothetical protein
MNMWRASSMTQKAADDTGGLPQGWSEPRAPERRQDSPQDVEGAIDHIEMIRACQRAGIATSHQSLPRSYEAVFHFSSDVAVWDLARVEFTNASEVECGGS